MTELTLKREGIHYGSLILVNADNPIVESFGESISLIPADINYPGCIMESKAAAVLSHIFKELGRKDGIALVSGYRTLSEQKKIWNNSLAENGERFTRAYVALPDHSEHQTGLAVDLGLRTGHIDFIRPDFPYEGVCGEFRGKALECGFIERYKKEKEHITGISGEPWHFRYVGYPHSLIMNRYELCLEEYIEKIKSYTYGGRRFCYWHNGQEAEIFYVPAKEDGVTITLPENALYQVSGNNVDGFIITLWRKHYGM